MNFGIFSNLKLSQKGLLLVCGPAVLMVGFLVALLVVMQNMETEINESARSKEIISETSRLTKLCYDMGVQVVLLDYTKSATNRNRLDEMTSEVPAHFQRLRELAKSDPTELELIRHVEELSNKIDARVARYRQYLKNKDAYPFINYSNMYSEMKSLATEFTNAIHSLTAYETSKDLTKLHSEPQVRAIIKTWIIAGVILNIVGGIVLAISFNRIAAHRLKLLTDNTLRLAQNAPLHFPLSGNDEIAQLDRFFHSMATALAAAARKERAVIENAVDVICSIDDRGNFTAVNPASEVVWGYLSNQLIGRPYSTILHPDDLPAFSKGLSEAQTDRKTLIIESRTLHKNGTTIFIRWSLRWSDTENSSFCVAHDITDRKELERVKEEFIAMVSHDLRTPLTSLGAILTLVLEGNYGALTEHGKVRIAGAEQDIERLIKMINDLLDIEMLESGHLSLTLEQVDMDTVINRSVDAVRGFADQKKLTLEVIPLHVMVSADADRLVQVCVNFLSNAIKFSDKNSTVSVLTKLKDDAVEVQVVDQGPGIPLGYSGIIFERYKRIKDSRGENQQGIGLGLAISKTIITQHGGEIGVESEPGKGSTFWFRVPIVHKNDEPVMDRAVPLAGARLSA